MAPVRKGNAVAPAGADTAAARRSANPAVLLQRKIGNRATGQLLARAPAAKDYGTVRIGKLPTIKIVGGTAGEWAAKKDSRTLEITSMKGKHSAALERLSKDGSKIPTLKVTTPIVDQNGRHLNFGSVELEFSHASIADYAVDGKVETCGRLQRRPPDDHLAHDRDLSRSAAMPNAARRASRAACSPTWLTRPGLRP